LVKHRAAEIKPDNRGMQVRILSNPLYFFFLPNELGRVDPLSPDTLALLKELGRQLMFDALGFVICFDIFIVFRFEIRN
jgi:hypothetical protein